MADLADALREPISLHPNRIPRFYRGGLLLNEFRGQAGASDDERRTVWREFGRRRHALFDGNAA